MPLLAAVIDLLVSQGRPFFTDAVGGPGRLHFGMIVQIIYLFAFGVAVIQANNIWRGRRATSTTRGRRGGVRRGGFFSPRSAFNS